MRRVHKNNDNKKGGKEGHTHIHTNTRTLTQQRAKDSREGGQWEFLYQDAKKVKIAKEKLTRYGKFISRLKCVCVCVCVRVCKLQMKRVKIMLGVCMCGGGEVVRSKTFNLQLKSAPGRRRRCQVAPRRLALTPPLAPCRLLSFELYTSLLLSSFLSTLHMNLCVTSEWH